MGFKQASLCLLVAVAVTADYQAPSDYRRPQTSYGTPAPYYGAPGGNRGSGGGDGGGHGGGRGGGGGGYGGDERPKSYQFGYAVKDYASGNDFGRHETSDGDTVTGQYRVQLPDGRTQIVTYTADWKNGFQADVKYEGEAFYPDKQQNYGNNDYNNNNQHGGSNFGSSDHQGSNFGSSGSNFGSSSSHGNNFGSSGSHGSNFGSSGHNDNNYGSYRRGGSTFGHDSYSNPGSNSKGYSQGASGYGK